MIALITLVGKCIFGLAMMNTVKPMEIIVITIIVILFDDEDHDAFGTHEIHAGIIKILTKLITIKKVYKYRIMFFSLCYLAERFHNFGCAQIPLFYLM